MRVLGVDLGRKRIGLAVSDSEARVAFPAGILESRGRRRDLAALCALIREREIARAVVGVPLHLDGRRGPEAESALRFAGELARAAGIPVDTLDERWTSLEAERGLRESAAGRRAIRARAGAVDEAAAAILLRTYLALPTPPAAPRTPAPPPSTPSVPPPPARPADPETSPGEDDDDRDESG